MNNMIIITALFTVLSIFNISNFIYNLMKLEAINITQDERKITLNKLCIYGVLSAICGLVITTIALNFPGVAYLV